MKTADFIKKGQIIKVDGIEYTITSQRGFYFTGKDKDGNSKIFTLRGDEIVELKQTI